MDVERSIAAAEAYDAIENLINAFGYASDGTAAGDGLDPVREPSLAAGHRDRQGRPERTVRARLLELQGTSAGAGAGAAGGRAPVSTRARP